MKSDKLIVVLGVFILVLASIGVYYWAPAIFEESNADLDDLFDISSEFLIEPEALTISDSCPFYALIATPLAVHYDESGEQFVAPLFVEKPGETSDAVIMAESRIGLKPINEISHLSAKEFSLYIAEKYWKSSDAALLIQNNETGYCLGVPAAPIASYLGIPIIVTDELDVDVRELLDDLGVTTTIICGDLDGYMNTLRFENIDEITDVASELIWEKFEHDVEYITLTNPKDAFPPEILAEEIVLSEKGTLSSGNALPSKLIKVISSLVLGKDPTHIIKIPEDYKYALVKLDVINLEDPENVEKFGDSVIVQGSFTGYCRTCASPSIRNGNGDLEHDRLHFESVFYDSGGEEYTVKLSSAYMVLDSAEYEVTATAYKLCDPYYPMMQQFSSIAPYLTAYHKGVIFSNPDFAFAANDDVKYNGKTLPGNTQVFFNPMLIPLVNQHVYENIHVPLNELIAKLRDIDISDSTEALKEDCYTDPLFVALVGDTIMLPQYYYRSPHSDPFKSPKSGAYGTNCPSDFIYGNIDPEIYSLLPYNPDHLENDLYSELPEAENIVGRITGWDVQDASALIARTIFYDKVIAGLGEWKDNAVVLVGAGTEMQKLPIFTTIRNILGKTDPIKFPSGEKKFLIKRVLENFEEGGFNAQSAEKARAQRVGYSTEALLKIKTDGPLNFLFFPLMLVKMAQGFEKTDDLFKPKWYIETALSDQSELVVGGKLQQNSNLIISDSHAIWFEKEHGDVLLNALGGPIILYQLLARFLQLYLRSPLDTLGAYSVRDVAEMEMGPSVLLIEGCGSGKIDGFHPTNSLANAYLHAGVNAYISPTTFSAFYGALEPRPNFNGGVGLGIAGYLIAALNARKGIYPEVYFNQYMFEQMVLEMAADDVPIGVALRNAKNDYLEAQLDITFRWTPPLSTISGLPKELQDDIDDSMYSMSGSDSRFPVEKYCTIYQINLLGDPAFNPYEPKNNG